MSDLWRLSCGCLEVVWKLFGGYLVGVWPVSGRCPLAVRRVSEGCLEGALRGSGIYGMSERYSGKSGQVKICQVH